MKDVGRNDPCPCGSGKKFKKCCLGTRETSVPFTERDRESALVELADFASRADLEAERLAAGVAFWNGWLDAHPEDEGGPGMDLTESVTAFSTWFSFDYRLASGQTVLERMLQRQGARLSRGEREYLARMRESHLRLYQVTDVKAGEALRLIDLWTGEQVWVRERLGTSQLVRWDLLAVRLMRGAEGELVIDGQPYLYPVGAKDALLKNLKRLHRDMRRASPFTQLTPAEFFKRLGMLFHHFWLEWVALRPLPAPVTAEDDPMAFARAVFEVRDREALVAALAGHPDLEREEDGGFAWTEDAPDFRRSLGRFVLEGDRLVLETFSEKRVERGRAFVESLAGDAIRFQLVECEDAQRVMERMAPSLEQEDEGGQDPGGVRGRGERAALP